MMNEEDEICRLENGGGHTGWSIDWSCESEVKTLVQIYSIKKDTEQREKSTKR